MREEWQDIEGYQGLYQVSNMGRVKSLERMRRNGKGYQRIPEKILRAAKNNNGYLLVNLYKEGVVKHYYVHQLVGNAFLSNPHGYKEINHISEDKTDNRAENLEWVSHEYNCNYGTRNKRVAEKLRGRKLSEEHIRKVAEKNKNNPKLSKPVIAINKVSGLIVEFPSAMEAGRTLGINQSNITQCCQGKRKSAGGFYWHYSESEEGLNEQEQEIQ